MEKPKKKQQPVIALRAKKARHTSEKEMLRQKEVSAQIQHLGQHLSTATVMMHAAIAERFGLSATDAKCMNFIRVSEAITAGQLAERSGLTTGAITGVIDRLEKAGFVRRTSDPKDRRRVMIELLHDPRQEKEIMKLYAPLAEGAAAIAAEFTAEELETIARFVTKSIAMLEAATQRLRDNATSSPSFST
jgi:DNA-binding MarR family transcriptional regulator